MLHVALWEPEIPPNTGNVARLCAATGARLLDNHLINNVIFSLIQADGGTPLPKAVTGVYLTDFAVGSG